MIQQIPLIHEESGIHEYCLDNGLKILLVPNHAAPVVTVMIVYRIGSRNEAIGYTGATHFLEHLLFKGTPTFNREKGNPIAQILQAEGADFNATTSFDRTNYFETLPADKLELALEIEADRMRNAFVSDEDRQAEMTVVRNELERHESEPDAAIWTHLFANAFLAHPYHHPTIGWHSDVEGMPTERIRQFYHDFYYPDNATLIVVGDLDIQRTLTLIVSHFGKIGPSPKPMPPVHTFDFPQEGERRFKLRRPGQLGIVQIAYHVPPLEHQDSYALNILQDILSDGVNSRLYQALVEKHRALYVGAYNIQLRDPGLFVISAKIAHEVTHENVEQAIYEVFEDLRQLPPIPREMERIKNQIKAEFSYSRHGTQMLANVLAEFEAMASWRYMMTYLEHLEKVTAEDVIRVLDTYLLEDNRTVGWFVPEEAQRVQVRERSENLYDTERKIQTAEIKKPVTESEIFRLPLADQAVLLVQENHLDNTVALFGSLRAGAINDSPQLPGVASMTAMMLKKGTRWHTKLEMAEQLAYIGSSLNFATGLETLSVRGRTLNENLETTLGLLLELLTEPVFPEEEFNKLKKQRIDRLRQRLESTDAMAGQLMYQQLYPKGHPYYQYSVEELIATTEEIGLKDIQQFYQRHYGTHKLILTVVGDADRNWLQEKLQIALAQWKHDNPIEIVIPDIPLQLRGGFCIHPMPDKQNVSILLGHQCSLKRHSPDFFAASLANQALGHSSISSRLGLRIRDELGLTYGIYSYFLDVGLGSGPWLVSVTTHPQNVERVVDEVKQVVTDYIEEGITEAELAEGKSSLIGSYLVGLSTNPDIACRLTAVEHFQLGLDYFQKRKALIEQVSRQEVNDAIRKYFHPDRFTVAVAGVSNAKWNMANAE